MIRPPSSSVRNDGLSLASDSTVVSRSPSSRVTVVPVGAEHRDHLPLEAPFVGGGGGELLAARPELVELLTCEVPLVGDQLGGDALRNEAALVGVAGADRRTERPAELAVGHRRPHRHTGHHLHAPGDDDVVGAGDDPLGGEVGGLLAGAALAVDRRAGDGLRPAGRQARRCGPR